MALITKTGEFRELFGELRVHDLKASILFEFLF